MKIIENATVLSKSAILQNYKNQVVFGVYGTGTFTVSALGGISASLLSRVGFIKLSTGEKVSEITESGLYAPITTGGVNYLQASVDSISGGSVSVEVGGN